MKKWRSIAAGLMAALLLLAASGRTALPARAASWNAAYAYGDLITITFLANGGTGALPGPILGVRGVTTVIPSAELTGPEHGLFAGWSTNPLSATPEYSPGDAIFLTDSKTLYAVYIPACSIEYRVGGDVTTELVLSGGVPARIPSLEGTGYSAWTDSLGKLADPSGPVWEDQVFTAVPASYSEPEYPALSLNISNTHDKYMDGRDDGLFHPEQALTRAELAQILYAVVQERPETSPVFSDVEPGAWYAPAVETAAGLGILDVSAEGAFRPDQAVTRAECAAALSRLIPYDSQDRAVFSDVAEDYWAYDAICRVGGYGLFLGDGSGNFDPDGALSRAETAVVLNRLLGREPDAAALAGAAELRVFPDVPTTHWAYGSIMEATVSHENAAGEGAAETWTAITAEKTALADGYYRFNGWLYCVKGGVFLHGTAGQTYTDGVFTYDENGRYTTGNAELDRRLNAIVEAYTNSSMTRDEKLRALFYYVRDNYTYLSRPLVSAGQTGWEPEYALFFLQNGKGNCFSFSAAYCLLCRELGQPAYTVVGLLGRNATPHGWVEIVLDGARYIFDTQLAQRYYYVHGLRNYSFFKLTPGNTPLTYIWQ